MAVEIEHATVVDDELVSAFQRLVPQLSSSSPHRPPISWRRSSTSPGSVLFLARVDGAIVGTLTLVSYRTPSGLKTWIEDVIVDTSASRQGIGEALNRAALDEARRRGAKDVSLTSRPSREAANRLYQRIGFERRETNVYRYSL